MSDHYHDPADKKLMREMRKLAPAEFEAWLNLNNIVGKDGAIPKRYRELIAIGVALLDHAVPVLHRNARQGGQGGGRDA